MASTALCNCGRALDWRTLINSNQLYSASLSCETCNTSLSINNSFSNNNSNNNNNASSPPTSPKNYNVTVRSPSFKGKGKGKEREGGNEGLTGDRSTYARLQMLRLKNKFVYNPYQGYELEAPKYSGMLFIFGKEWLVDSARRTACSLCATKFDFFNRRVNCRACGEVVCKSCSPKTVEVAAYGGEKQRVCNKCLSKGIGGLEGMEEKGENKEKGEWRERFVAIQNNVLYLRHRPVLEEQAKGAMPLADVALCEAISDVSVRAETGSPPPPDFLNFCFKVSFHHSKDTVDSDVVYFCAKSQELMNSWIVAIKESSKAKQESQEKSKQSKLNSKLLKASKVADAKQIKDLLKQGADPNYAHKKTGLTSLMHCARSGRAEATLCSTLLLQSKATPNAQDSTGKTALHMSVTTGQEGVAEDDTVLDVLLRYGADQAVEEGLLGLTAFEFAKHENVHDIAAKIHHYENSIEMSPKGLKAMLERGSSINWRDGQGNSLVHLACLKKDVETLRFLIDHQANLNVENLYGHAAIHEACISNFEAGIRLLLEYKAFINIQDNMGYTPLHFAVIFNSPECVEVLLNRGANPNLRSSPSSGAVSPLHLAACLGYKDIAENLLKKGSDPNMEDDLGQTPITISKRFDTPILPLLKTYTDLHKLFLWCKEPTKRPDIEQLLTSDKTLNINWPNGEKMTMLHVATIAQNLPVVELLLSHHANFDINDSYGNTPIDIANGTEKTPLNPSPKNEKIHQRFLQYRRINALNDFILSGSLPDVKRLLKESPTEYNLHVHNGMAPLHIAAQNGYVAICKRLMKGGARIDFPSTKGKTAVHVAAEDGKVDCLRMFLSDPVGKSVVNSGDSQGDTPLILCVTKSPDTLEETCEMLLSHGAEVEKKNRDGQNAIDVSKSKAFNQVLTRHRNGVAIVEAARRGDSKCIDNIFKLPEKERPAADFQDLNGKTALHYACASQEGETCVSILLRNGARVEIRDKDEKTPLDILKSRPHTERTQRLLTQFAAGIQVSIFALSGQKQRMQQLLTKFNIDVDFCDQIEMKTPLHWACISGSRTCVEYLLNQGASIDVKDKNSETPLFLAVRNGHKDLVEVLLTRGANPEISDACGVKLIDSICDRSRAKDQLERGLELFFIMHLLNINIGDNEKEDVERMLNSLAERLEFENKTLIPEIKSLLEKHINGRKFVEEYSAKGDVARLREMYTQIPGILNYKSNGETALHHAVKKAFYDVVEDLLEQGALVSIYNNNKKTPVDIANDMLEKKESTTKVTKILELLHKYGCGPDVINLCHDGKEESLEELLSKNVPLGFNPNYKFKGDFTGLHVAAAHGHLPCMEVLLKYNAAADKQDADGYTPLHYAARYGKEQEVKKLLEAGVDVEQRNDQGLTPLMMAAIGEHNVCVQILTAFGAEVNVQNNNRQTPLMLAAKSGFTECVKLLLEKGADPNIIDNSKNSALHYATLNGYVEIIKLLLGAKKIDPNMENRMAHSPIIIATAKGNATLLSILLGSKATNPNFGSRISPVFVAINNSNIECLKLLLDNKADANAIVADMTPLHLAVLRGDVPIIEMLLSYGADPLIQTNLKIDNNTYKVTPLDLVQVAHVSGTRSVPTQLLRCKAGANAIREAISKGEITALKQLLADYSDADVVNYQDREGKTPLHWACEKEYASCVKAVLVFYPNLNLKDKEGNTAMAIARKNANEEVKQELQRYENATKLLKEATDGNENELRKIIERGDVDIEFTKADKNTVVHLCAGYGYTSCLKLLLTKASHLANRPNSEKQLPIHLAAERGHAECVQELINYTKPGGKALHEELWDLAEKNLHRDVIMWLRADLCSYKELPAELFPAPIEIEYHFGDLVSFLSVPEDVSLYELERQLYTKLKRYTILEQRIQQGRTQIRDDVDLKKAISTAKENGGGKTVVVFYCVQNLENKPIAQPPQPDNPNLKPINNNKIRVGASGEAETKSGEAANAGALNTEQFSKLKDFISDKFTPFQKDLEKEMKKISMQVKLVSQQNSDIYDEIQSTKANDRDFISSN